MDKEEAQELLTNKLAEYRNLTYDELVAKIGNDDLEIQAPNIRSKFNSCGITNRVATCWYRLALMTVDFEHFARCVRILLCRRVGSVLGSDNLWLKPLLRPPTNEALCQTLIQKTRFPWISS